MTSIDTQLCSGSRCDDMSVVWAGQGMQSETATFRAPQPAAPEFI